MRCFRDLNLWARTTLALATLLLVSGCGTSQWQRQEVVDWCRTYVQPPKHLRYCGSDEKWHYFIARPIDEFVLIKVARSEIIIADERAVSDAGRLGYYPVDPASGFGKLPE